MKKVYVVMQGFNDVDEGYEPKPLKTFATRAKADKYIKWLFADYKAQHPDYTTQEAKQYFEQDFDTFVQEEKVE